jgi:hypothetical protein
VLFGEAGWRREATVECCRERWKVRSFGRVSDGMLSRLGLEDDGEYELQ